MTTVSQIYDKDQKLEQALDAVADIEPDFESALLTSADAEAEFDVQWAKEFLAAEGSVEARKATATIKTAKYLVAKNTAKAIKEFVREKLKDRQASVSARQSLLAAEVKTNQRF